MCCWLWILCHTTQHGSVLIIFPLNRQTITITRMLSSGGQGRLTFMGQGRHTLSVMWYDHLRWHKTDRTDWQAYHHHYTGYSSYGYRTSAVARPRLWNSLPVQLCNPDINYGLFSSFSGTMNTALRDFWYAAPYKNTYLLTPWKQHSFSNASLQPCKGIRKRSPSRTPCTIAIWVILHCLVSTIFTPTSFVLVDQNSLYNFWCYG